MTIAAIDFGRLYRDHLAAATARRLKPASAWDTRAGDMRRKALESRYVDEFVGRMNLAGAHTLLDVGCGPGTIGLAVARRLSRVYGLDYSRKMLDALLENAAARAHANVEALHLSWDDDWSQVPACDIVVASRSTVVEDMADALAKLDAKARLRVYLTNLVGGRFIDPALFEVLRRQQSALPDYIYVLNILHGMGIHPRLDYIEHEGRLVGVTEFDDLLRRVEWSLGELNPEELIRLRDWHAQGTPGAGAPMRWAFISWEKAHG